MKLKFGKKTSARKVNRLKTKVRIRKKIEGTADRPRLSVYRSSKHIYAQVINDETGTTLVSTSTLKVAGVGSNCAVAKEVGEKIAQLAMSKEIKSVVFDRNGFVYHGRVKAVADGAREAGLIF